LQLRRRVVSMRSRSTRAHAGAATSELVATIGRAGPFGAGNPEPVLALPSHTIAYAEEVGQAHVRVRLRAGDGAMINAIAFRAAGQPLGSAIMQSRGLKVHAAGCWRLTAAGRGACAAPAHRHRARRSADLERAELESPPNSVRPRFRACEDIDREASE